MATLFQYKNVSIQVAATKPSLTFFQAEDIRRQGVDIWTDDDEWDVRETLPPRDFRLRAIFFLYNVAMILPFSHAHTFSFSVFFLHLPAKLPHRRPDITHRAPSVGRRGSDRALLSEHTRQDRQWRVRQSRGELAPVSSPSPICLLTHSPTHSPAQTVVGGCFCLFFFSD